MSISNIVLSEYFFNAVSDMKNPEQKVKTTTKGSWKMLLIDLLLSVIEKLLELLNVWLMRMLKQL